MGNLKTLSMDLSMVWDFVIIFDTLMSVWYLISKQDEGAPLSSFWGITRSHKQLGQKQLIVVLVLHDWPFD